jgi:hypothetical protein
MLDFALNEMMLLLLNKHLDRMKLTQEDGFIVDSKFRAVLPAGSLARHQASLARVYERIRIDEIVRLAITSSLK